MNFPIRYVAQIVIEAMSPLAIGSNLLIDDQDSPVEKDFNNLPYIPGTAIAGFLRNKATNDSLFGDKATDNESQPIGSNLVISDAFLMDDKGKVHQQSEEISNAFLQKYFNLPVRQHTAINEFGAAKKGSKFDTEVAFKGSRFKFEIELQLEKENDTAWKNFLESFFTDDFYLGGGQFNNFGEMKVKKIKCKKFDLKEENEKQSYINHDVDLNTDSELTDTFTRDITKTFTPHKFTFSGKDSFFHFGAGLGDDEADEVNYKEYAVEWENGKPTFVEKFVIPGTSLKGVIAHRVAFYYNKNNNDFVEDLLSGYEQELVNELDQSYNLDDFQIADQLEELEKQKQKLTDLLNRIKKKEFNANAIFKKVTGENNKAVQELFGMAKDGENNGKTGKIIFKDIYLDAKTPEIIFNHNKIDRYTGGTIESALYNEKVLAIDTAVMEYKVKNDPALSALNQALDDLKNGKLPIGGLVNKGHGILKELKND